MAEINIPLEQIVAKSKGGRGLIIEWGIMLSEYGRVHKLSMVPSCDKLC